MLLSVKPDRHNSTVLIIIIIIIIESLTLFLFFLKFDIIEAAQLKRVHFTLIIINPIRVRVRGSVEILDQNWLYNAARQSTTLTLSHANRLNRITLNQFLPSFPKLSECNKQKRGDTKFIEMCCGTESRYRKSNCDLDCPTKYFHAQNHIIPRRQDAIKKEHDFCCRRAHAHQTRTTSCCPLLHFYL